MINSFFGFDMGKRALNYIRRGFETAGHNISNTETPGYSRQRVEPSTTYPFTAPGLHRPAIPGQIGTGVKIDAIVRLRDQFLDLQYREEVTVEGYWDVMTDALDTLETFVNEPQGKSLKVGLDDFWAAIQELSKAPDKISARENLISKAGTLATYMDSLARNYEEYREGLNREVRLKVQQANTYIDQIAALNVTIREIEGAHANPNDLYDRRDLLAESLCKLIDAEVNCPCDADDGEYKIYLGGRILVQGEKARHLELTGVAGNRGYYDVQVEDNRFDYVSDPNVISVSIEQQATKAIHAIAVRRMANTMTWKVGGAPIDGVTGRLPVSDPKAKMEISGVLRLQVGTAGVQPTGKEMDNQMGSPVLLKQPAGDDPTEYVFRIASQDLQNLPGNPNELYVTLRWDAAASAWQLSSRCGSTLGAVTDVGNALDLDELQDFLQNTSGVGAHLNFSVETSGTVDRLVVRSEERHLLSFNDMKGSFLSDIVGLSNDSPEVVITIEENDSLETIANKINGSYNNGVGMPDDPNQWLHAAIKTDGKGDYHLVLESDAVGEGQRINVMGSVNGETYAARRLGFMNGDHDNYTTEIVDFSTDALVMVDNERYLSVSNDFRRARILSAADGYKASVSDDVTKGIVYHLHGYGPATIQVDHHVKGGEIRALLESRDDVILNHLDIFDDIAYGLISEMNAVHYAGHGMGAWSDTTGVAFFTPIHELRGAARKLAVNELLRATPGLLGAAADDGQGHAKGIGNGDNAINMAQLKQAKVLAGDSASFNEYYENFIARLGVRSERSQNMLSNQTALIDQIEGQRQSVMGVNIDEEMMDIMQFQQAFNAVSRFVTTLDEMLERVINGMGRVGL
ncbi:MAG: flagellar hook-associated protein FlgK [Dethiosulfovibrio peptidovorans]|nr:MAG: flagellar hook-associated protein FlgK [Dethiosulfovibrio peptidovorans]